MHGIFGGHPGGVSLRVMMHLTRRERPACRSFTPTHSVRQLLTRGIEGKVIPTHEVVPAQLQWRESAKEI